MTGRDHVCMLTPLDEGLLGNPQVTLCQISAHRFLLQRDMKTFSMERWWPATSTTHTFSITQRGWAQQAPPDLRQAKVQASPGDQNHLAPILSRLQFTRNTRVIESKWATIRRTQNVEHSTDENWPGLPKKSTKKYRAREIGVGPLSSRSKTKTFNNQYNWTGS